MFMKRQTLALLIGIITIVAGIAFARLVSTRTAGVTLPAATSEVRSDWQAGRYKLSGPYTHRNLTVFLVRGQDEFAGEPFLTLQEAMERKLVVVHETQEVNELSVENLSSKEEVFIQAGDIVKGGQQDRVLAVDLIVPTRSGRLPIDAFCVEQGRWNRRGGELAEAFSMSGEMIATRELKMAAKGIRSQAEVWAGVDEAQAKLSASMNANVRAEESSSSLQLSLENEKVRESADGYVKALSRIIEVEQDVVGYVFTVNGRVSGADIYSSSALFRKLWPRLLKASSIEALAELPDYDGAAQSSAELVDHFLMDAENGHQTERDVTKRTKMLKREGKGGIFFETRDMEQNGMWIHRSYLATSQKPD
jgi:hypothetical protein